MFHTAEDPGFSFSFFVHRFYQQAWDARMEIYELQSLSRVGSTSMMAPDWLHKSEQPIRSQVRKLTQLLTMTQTHKFSLQIMNGTLEVIGGEGWAAGEREEGWVGNL